MKYEQRKKIIEQANERRQALMINKGKEYSGGNEDINYNFIEVANRLGSRLAGTKEFVCLVYLEKHILSIEKWARDGKLSSGETIFSRLDDARNYMDILESILRGKSKTKSVVKDIKWNNRQKSIANILVEELSNWESTTKVSTEEMIRLVDRLSKTKSKTK